MKDYPVDKFDVVFFYPMNLATRVRSKPLKLLLALVYFPWALALLPIVFVLLAISIPLSVWDDLNDPDFKS